MNHYSDKAAFQSSLATLTKFYHGIKYLKPPLQPVYDDTSHAACRQYGLILAKKNKHLCTDPPADLDFKRGQAAVYSKNVEACAGPYTGQCHARFNCRAKGPYRGCPPDLLQHLFNSLEKWPFFCNGDMVPFISKPGTINSSAVCYTPQQMQHERPWIYRAREQPDQHITVGPRRGRGPSAVLTMEMEMYHHQYSQQTDAADYEEEVLEDHEESSEKSEGDVAENDEELETEQIISRVLMLGIDAERITCKDVSIAGGSETIN